MPSAATPEGSVIRVWTTCVPPWVSTNSIVRCGSAGAARGERRLDARVGAVEDGRASASERERASRAR